MAPSKVGPAVLRLATLVLGLSAVLCADGARVALETEDEAGVIAAVSASVAYSTGANGSVMTWGRADEEAQGGKGGKGKKAAKASRMSRLADKTKGGKRKNKAQPTPTQQAGVLQGQPQVTQPGLQMAGQGPAIPGIQAPAIQGPASQFPGTKQQVQPASPAVGQGSCLCVFDVDRTLTARQGSETVSTCPGVEKKDGVKDTAYGGGTLIFSELGQQLKSSFCGACYFAIVSHGDASGPGSQVRSEIDKLVDSKYNVGGWVDGCPSPVSGTKVLRCSEGQKQSAVADVLKYFKQNGIDIPDSAVHFYDDKKENIDGFKGTAYNAHMVSCGSRDKDRGKCGGTLSEIASTRGQKINVC